MPIYLDYAASTPLDPRVASLMQEFLTDKARFGNPSAQHDFGKAAKESIEIARAQVADLIAAEPSEIIWTSGATESINLALKGAAQLYQTKGRHIITLKTEHAAVLACCRQLEKENFTVTYLSPQKNGLLDFNQFQNAVQADTFLVSVMHVNNETGIVQDIQKLAEYTAARGILLHVDAAQSAGKMNINVQNAPIDFLSLSAHKVYGPKGIGALYLRRKPRVRAAAQIHGGGQENGMRSGTLATHQIAGMGEAFRLAKKEYLSDYENILTLRNRFLSGLQNFPSLSLNTDLTHSIPHILNISFKNKKGLLEKLPELAVSAGSACFSKGNEGSYVLRAMGLDQEGAREALRFSWGRFTTIEDIDFALKKITHLLL